MVGGHSRNLTMDNVQEQIDLTVNAAINGMTALVEDKIWAALANLNHQPSSDDEKFALAIQKAAAEAVAVELRRQGQGQQIPTQISLSRQRHLTHPEHGERAPGADQHLG